MASGLKMTFLFGRDTLQGDVMDDSCAGIHIHSYFILLLCPLNKRSSLDKLSRPLHFSAFLRLSTTGVQADTHWGSGSGRGSLSSGCIYSRNSEETATPNCLIGNHSLFLFLFFIQIDKYSLC